MPAAAEAVVARRDRPLSQAIAVLLIVGVGLSGGILLFGLLLLLITRHTGYQQDLSMQLLLGAQGSVNFPKDPSAVLEGAVALRPFAIVELGTLVLIATPVVRVAASVLLFLAENDRLYAFITLVVLALLLFSLFGVK